MKSARVLSPLLLCTGLGLAAPAQAENEGWYAVAFAGEASADGVDQAALDASLVLSGFTVDSSTVDDSDTAFGAAVGYQVTEYFAAELAYVDLGEISYRATIDGDDSATLDASARGPAFSLLGIVPIGERFAVYGRAGIALMDCEGEAALTIDGVTDSASDSTNRSNGLYGLGGEFNATDRFGVRLEWTRYADVGSDEITGEADVDVFALGLRINFR